MSSQSGRGQGRGRGRGDSGTRGGSNRGRGDSTFGGNRGDRGGRGDSPFRGNRGDRGGRGAFSQRGGRGDGGGRGGPVAFRGGPPRGGGNVGSGGIYLPNAVSKPDASITQLEDALVKFTKDKEFDGFPGRRGYGTKGREIVLRTNYFELKQNNDQPLYVYSISYDKQASKKSCRGLVEQLLKTSHLGGKCCATDYTQTLVMTERLPQNLLTLELSARSQKSTSQQAGPTPDFVLKAKARDTFKVKIQYKDTYNLNHMLNYLKSQSAAAEYQGRVDIIPILNMIVCKHVCQTQNIIDAGRNRFYPYSPSTLANVYDLGEGLEALRGYYASVRPAVGRLLLNLNVTSGAFYQPISLIDLLRAHGVQGEQSEQFIKGLRVKVLYIKDGQHVPTTERLKTIRGFAKPHPPHVRVKRLGNAKEVKFRYLDKNVNPQREREVTVQEYFKSHWGISLKRLDVPVLNCGIEDDPQYVPLELCVVEPGQAYRRLLSADQTTNMLAFAARFPNLNAVSIAGDGTNPGIGQRVFGIESDQAQRNSITKFGFRLGTQMLTVPGRVLDYPRVEYGHKKINTRNGSWNCGDQKFSRPGSFTAWSTLIVNRNSYRGTALKEDVQGSDMLSPDKLIDRLGEFLRDYGVRISRREKTSKITMPDYKDPNNRQETDRQLSSRIQAAAKAGIEMLLVILPEADRWLYSRIKYYGDVEYGVHTICAVGSKIQKPKNQGMYLGNLALKFNIKGGGVNHTVQDTLTKPVDKNTMLVGIDVTHPSPGSTKGAPSIACVVASIDEHLQQWPGSVRAQTGREEMVEGLKAMVMERLKLWAKKNQNRYPNKIVLYRDGVSEGQYSLVLDKEVPPFQDAFRELYGDTSKWPKLTIIIVGKRHHTRFYPTENAHADQNPQRNTGSWNPVPGTVVDRHISGKILREFWLQAHQGLQGTARPAHYVVIKDEIKFGADELEQFTHNLCYLFNRATKAVSICPPAYYADLLCERGRYYLYSALQENNGSDSSVYNSNQGWQGGVHARLAESTWYI